MKSVLRMLSELKNSKSLMLLILVCGALSSALKASTASLAKIMGDLIFSGVSKTSGPLQEASGETVFVLQMWSKALGLDPLVLTVLIMFGAFLFANLFRYIFMYKIRSFAETKAVEAREKLMRHYLYLDARYKNQLSEGSGSLISRILNDVNLYQEGIQKLSDLLKEPFLVVFATIWLFILSWKVGVFLFVGLPPILLIVKSLAKSLRRHSTKSQETMESLTMTLKEGLDGSRVVHSFNLEQKILLKFKEHTSQYLKTMNKIISREELSGPLTESISSLVFCGSFLLIAFLVRSEGLGFGDFFGISVAVGFLTDSAKKTQAAYIRIQKASVAKKRIDSILSSVKNRKSAGGKENFPKDLKEIEVRDLSIKIGEKHLLKDLNFTVKAGSTVALVGPSGSGKSSFLNSLDLFLSPTSGGVYFNGKVSTSIQDVELKKNLSLVSQDPFLFNESVYENLRLVRPNLTEKEAESVLKLANADFVLSLPEGIHTQSGERGVRFSGGERQRISIARAMIKNAPVLLLDEATSALDSQSEVEVQKGLDSLKEGKTCFVVAHRLSTIKHADRILVFNEGRIVEEGTHESLKNQQSLYAKLHSLNV